MKPRKLRTSRSAVAVLASGACLVTACSAGNGPGPGQPASSSGPAATATAPTGSVPAGGRVSTAPPGTEVSGTLSNGTAWVAEYPAGWNGTLILYSHGYGPLTAADAPDPVTQQALLGRGYALAGSSYDPSGSEWALNTAVSDQFGTLAAVGSTVLPHKPAHVIAFGSSMGGLVSALEAEQGQGRIDGALTTCGVVAGGVNLDGYQLDGEYAITQLVGDPATPLVRLNDRTAKSSAAALTAAAGNAQSTPAGRARLALAMAFLNLPTWQPNAPAPAPYGQPAAAEAAQYQALTSGPYTAIDFMMDGRLSIEQSAGGQPVANAGANFAQALANSPYRAEVASLYRAAGLNLTADLAALTAHATTKADPAALAKLRATSSPTGKLTVPELDLHTIGDNLVPVQQENSYAQLVGQAGGSLLRQAYTGTAGHCDFSVSEQVAGIEAVLQRVTTGQWGNVATAASLQQAASALQLGPARFRSYTPDGLTGAAPG